MITCAACGGTGKNRGWQCWTCKGKGALPPIRYPDESMFRLLPWRDWLRKARSRLGSFMP